MMKFLLEINDPTLLRLSAIEKAVLLCVYRSDTSELGHQAASGSDSIIAARQFLTKTGMMDSNDTQARITNAGTDVLEENGLIDQSGQVTENGNQMIEYLNGIKMQYTESLIPFKILKQIN